MTAIPISAAEGYGLWADTWDSTASPIVAVEQRALSPWIAKLDARRALDIGCGAGHPAELRLAQRLVRLRQPRLESL